MRGVVAARDVGGGDGGVVHVRGGHHGADGDPQHGVQHVSVMLTPSAELMILPKRNLLPENRPPLTQLLPSSPLLLTGVSP